MAENRDKGFAQASDDNSSGQTLQGGVDAFHMQALAAHFEKLLDCKLKGLHERLDQVENQVAGPRATNQRQAPYPRPQHPIHNEYLEDPSDGEEYENLRPRRRRVSRPRDRPRRPREEDGGQGGVKVTIPSFKGKSDPEAYLEWELHVEQIFSCHNYSKNKKDIAGVMEMHHYVELEKMVHQAIKVEQQLKQRGLVRRTSNSSTFRQWKNNLKKDTPSTSKFKGVFQVPRRGHIASEYPNRRTMIFNNHGELEIGGESANKEESLQEDDDVEDYEDVFPDEIPLGLPPIRGIEHQIDFMPGASLPNRPAYRTNPEETKEIQRQIQE
ncbi:UNVERIFIED_CONTAM: hypothetical protein Slati_0865400 [Sesamum latifolium]|uniref:Uncharacterized protein n=1 Tax=Sesamum latifolium TaxID=2727402 RepID=A0AAW2XM93_9LAMI